MRRTAVARSRRNRKPPVRMTSYGREYLVLMMLLLAVATIGKINLIFLMVGIFLAPILINRWMARRTVSSISLNRSHPTNVAAGTEFTVLFTAETPRNRRTWNFLSEDSLTPVIDTPVTGKIEPDTPSSTEPSRGSRSRMSAGTGRTDSGSAGSVSTETESADSRGAGSVSLRAFFPGFQRENSQRATVTVRLTRRGRYRFGPLRVITEAPFGLYRAEQVQSALDSELWVFPAPGRFTSDWRLRHPANRDTGSAKRVGAGQEFFGVREWRSGDSPRNMHWWASARHRQWIVRQFADSRMRCVVILLDLFRKSCDATTPGTPDEHRRDREPVERGIAMAATLLTDLYRGDPENGNGFRGERGADGGIFRLCLTSEPDRIEPEHFTQSAMNRAMQRLALARSHSDDRLETLRLRLMSQRSVSSRETEWIVISPRPRDLWESRPGSPHLPIHWLRSDSPESDPIFEWKNPDENPSDDCSPESIGTE
ncbi:MAG: DUF58 domain-containing protein [Planctomycetia bacterium]|nr:DUF58 domain-containing protein [Planctomycetia bacterium]